MRLLRSALAALVTVVALQATAHAHFIWAIVENNQARFALLENVSEAPNAKFEKYVTGLTPRCGGKDLTLGVPKDGSRSAALPAGQNVVLADSVIGAKEREGAPYLLIYHAKGAATLAAAGTNMKAVAEICARREGNTLVISVHQNEWPVPDCEVFVQWPGIEEGTSLKTDLKGEVRVEWPGSVKSGIVGVRAMIKEGKTGEHEGKKYESIHHWATLTFPAEGPKTASAH